ncbi:glycosyltransferase [Candidatus Woesebacteria bacterium]|nr:glycosyltransferase [Candidatus Woesebacteria bacterium]
MRILHLSTWKTGGSAIAAKRLSDAINKLGGSSKVVSMSSRIPSYIDAVIGKLTHTSNPIFHSYNYYGENITQKIADFKPDIIHVHWVGAGFVTPEHLANFNLPIVWTLHDLWPLCGAEHLPGSKRFQAGYLKQNRPTGESGLDLNRYLWDRKWKALRDANITYVAPSTYVYNMARRAKSLGNHKLVKIGNGVDISLFKPNAKVASKNPLVLYVAMNPELDPNKGYSDFKQALELLPESLRSKIIIKVIGGEIGSDVLMAKEYARATVTVVPSKIETLSYVAMESLSCGTPVVAYQVGGIPDLVQSNFNGYLAKPSNVKDLSRGIEKMLTSSSIIKQYRKNARQKIISRYNITNIAKEYLNLYRSI